eukprot:11565623-Alexandrium_andersonii.AAC.1
MSIRTAWRDVAHAGVTFAGRRISGVAKDCSPLELKHESQVPACFRGLSAFTAPSIVRRILRCDMPSLADIDLCGSYLVALDERVNGDAVNFPRLHEVVCNLATHRARVATACDVPLKMAKLLFVILQHGGSLGRWQKECGKAVISKLPRFYFEFADELTETIK